MYQPRLLRPRRNRTLSGMKKLVPWMFAVAALFWLGHAIA